MVLYSGSRAGLPITRFGMQTPVRVEVSGVGKGGFGG